MLADSPQKRRTIADGRAKNKQWPKLMKNNRIAADRAWRIRVRSNHPVAVASLTPDKIFMCFYSDNIFYRILTKKLGQF